MSLSDEDLNALADYEQEIALKDRIEELDNLFSAADMRYDEIEQYCISVLDSEFMNYKDGELEKELKKLLDSYLNNVY